MRRSRVVITGVGLLTPWGDQLARAWAVLSAGSREALGLHAGFPAAVVEDASPTGSLRHPKSLKLMDKRACLSVRAASAVIVDARLEINELNATRVGLYLCVGYSAVELADYLPFLQQATDVNGAFSSRLMGDSAWRLIHPLKPFQFLSNLPLCHVSIELGLRGDHAVFYPDALQGAGAIEEGFRRVEAGQVEAALVGGVSAVGNRLGLTCLRQKGISAATIAEGLPFSPNHQGCVPADACVYLVLETVERAAARNAKVYAEVAGLGFAGDRGVGNSGLAANVRKSLSACLVQASAGPPDIGGVWAGSYRSLADDDAELTAIEDVLGPGTRVTSTRGLLGHAFGAAPVLDLAVASQALAEGQLHPVGPSLEPPGFFPPLVRELTSFAQPFVVVNVLGEAGEAFSVALRRVRREASA